MLIANDSNLYVYVIARDFGFAPNPFFGSCTLATCKPQIRKSAKPNDWILGVAGKNLGPGIHRKCILLMKVTEKLTFEEYWVDPRFVLKRPCRNGSQVKMVGDNIYHKNNNGDWIQEDSHHSNPDSSTNQKNLNRDTGHCQDVLISNYFFYFGNQAVSVDLNSINYKSTPGCKKLDLNKSLKARAIIKDLYSSHKQNLNLIVSDPCQFELSHQRVDQGTGKLSG